MSWVDIYDGEGGDSVKDKINTAMDTLFDLEAGLWEATGGSIQPAAGEKVLAGEIEVTTIDADTLNADEVNVDNINVSGDLTLSSHTGHSGLKAAFIDTNGVIVPQDDEVEGDVQAGDGAVVITAAHDVLLSSPTVLADSGAGNVMVSLPQARGSKTAEVLVRKISDDAYSVSLEDGGPSDMMYDDDAVSTIETTEQGAWIRVKAVTQVVGETVNVNWRVISQGGTWTTSS